MFLLHSQKDHHSSLKLPKNNRRNKCGEKYGTLYSVDCQAVCFLLTKELDQRAFNGNRIISRYTTKAPLDHTDDCVIVKTGSKTFDK